MTFAETNHRASTPRTTSMITMGTAVPCALAFAAQGIQDLPPLSGGSSTGAATIQSSGTEGAGGENGAGAAPPSMGMEPMLIILVVFGAIILFSVFGQRKEKKRRQQMLDSIKKSDSVQTIGGVIGSVVEVKNETIVIRVDDRSDTRMTFSRAAVQQVLSQPDNAD